MSNLQHPVLNPIAAVPLFFGTAVLWEFVTWWMDKYRIIRFGWFFHGDHHTTSGRRLHRNDAYVVFFALFSFLLIFFGLRQGRPPMAASGFGVALYGAGYVAFHDIMFHRRVTGI